MSDKSANHFSKTTLTGLLVAAAYFMLGLLGLEFAISPTKIGVIWLPAGVGLASVLLWGNRMCAAIFLGNFCISSFAFGWNQEYAFLYIATSLGAGLSAFVGAHMVRRYPGFPNELIDDRAICQFLLAGSCGCIVSASIGISALLFTELITAPQVPTNWLIWWIGDTIGVVLFSPLVIAFFSPEKQIWKRRRMALAIPFLILFCTVNWSFLYFKGVQTQKEQGVFREKTLITAKILDSHIQTHANTARLLAEFFINSEEITLTEFNNVNQQTLTLFPDIQSINWIEKLPETEAGIKYSLKNPLYSHHSPESLLGSPFPKKAAILFHENRLVFTHPVYKNNELQGHILISSAVAELVSKAFSWLKPETGLYLEIKGGDPETVIYSSAKNEAHEFTQQYVQPILNENITLDFYRYRQKHSIITNYLWFVIVGGLVIAGLLGAITLILTGRYFRIKNEVEERTNELRFEKSRAENANSAKNLFLSNISHELRTPLNGILGFSKLLQKNNGLSGEDKEKIYIIDHCANHLLMLVNDILDFARIENNKVVIENNGFDFNTFINNIIEIFLLKASEKSLRFEYDCQPVSHYVNGDEKHLRQIVINLLGNAFKFTQDGEVRLKTVIENDSLNLTVEDTGCGISEDKLGHIFSAFVQINEGHDFAKEGIGLGLSISQQLAALMGGGISVESAVGQGSRFTLTLPLQQTEARLCTEQHYVEKNDHAMLPSLDILIADDNEINLLLLANLLQGANHRVSTALNGKEALELAGKKSYHLALIDLNMPVMTGFEFIQALRSQGDVNQDIRVAAVSAYADNDNIGMAMDSGFDYYLTKPVDEEDLERLLRRIARGVC